MWVIGMWINRVRMIVVMVMMVVIPLPVVVIVVVMIMRHLKPAHTRTERITHRAVRHVGAWR